MERRGLRENWVSGDKGEGGKEMEVMVKEKLDAEWKIRQENTEI